MIKFKQYLFENDNLNWRFTLAAEGGNLETVKRLLKNGADVHFEDDLALRNACKEEPAHTDIIKYLIQNGANVNAGDDYALRTVVFSQNIGLLELLVNKGANINAFNGEPLKSCLFFVLNESAKFLLGKGSKIDLNYIDQRLDVDKKKNIVNNVIIPVFEQEWVCKHMPTYIKFIKDLDPKLLDKYSHLIMGNKFGVFEEN